MVTRAKRKLPKKLVLTAFTDRGWIRETAQICQTADDDDSYYAQWRGPARNELHAIVRANARLISYRLHAVVAVDSFCWVWALPECTQHAARDMILRDAHERHARASHVLSQQFARLQAMLNLGDMPK